MLPDFWDDVVGNYEAKTYLKELARLCIDENVEHKPPIALVGDSRTGKTAMVKLFSRAISCHETDPETVDPCDGSCPACKQMIASYGISEIYSELFVRNSIEYFPVDCGLCDTKSSLTERLQIHTISRLRPRVYFLDEVHRLFSKKLDEALLKTVEDNDVFWFFATSKPEAMDEAFRNRVTFLETQIPSLEEIAEWLLNRAEKLGIDVSIEETVNICQSANRNPGLALKSLLNLRFRPEANGKKILRLCRNNLNQELQA